MAKNIWKEPKTYGLLIIGIIIGFFVVPLLVFTEIGTEEHLVNDMCHKTYGLDSEFIRWGSVGANPDGTIKWTIECTGGLTSIRKAN